jgi:mono/diheme cytochrome c family protein
MRFRPITLLLAAALAAGCAATAKRGEPYSADPSEADPAVARGHVVYMQHCQACHPFGDGGLAPSIVDKPLPGVLMKLQVRAGFGAMPAFPSDKLDDRQLDDLITYIEALRAQQPRPDEVAPPK